MHSDAELAKRLHSCGQGARVILLHNLDLEAAGEAKLCNGSLGVVGPFPTEEEVSLALEEKTSELDVAISRLEEQLRSGDHRSTFSLERRLRVHRLYRARLLGWVRADRRGGDDVAGAGGCWSRSYLVPRVYFDNGRTMLVLPVMLQSDVVGQGSCYRLQLPLKTAWAVHPPDLTPLPSPPIPSQ